VFAGFHNVRALIKRKLSNIILSLAVALILAAGAALSLWSNATLRESRDLVVHSHQVIEAGKDLLLALDDAETGQRGYLIVGDGAYLEPYEKGRSKAAAAVDRLAQLVPDNVQQLRRAAQAHSLAAQKLEELESVIRENERNGFAAARMKVASNTGKNTMDALRRVLADMQTAEETLLTTRAAEVRRNESRVLISGALVAAISLLTRLLVWFVRRRKAA